MRYLLLVSALFLTTLVACQQNTPPAEGTMSTIISVEDAKQLLASDAAVQILDVRTPEEHVEGHIKGCTLMNYYDDDFDAQIATVEKEKAVFVYCKSGGRSGKTAKMLRAIGVKEIYDLEGGFTAWETAGEAVEK